MIDVRHIGGPDDESAPPETINLPGIAALPIRADGRDRLLLLLDFGDAADSVNGFAVLALYDLSSAERLLDAANVAYDRGTWFRQGASLAISPDTDAVVTMSAHFNSNQAYDTTALILPRDDRLELIDTIFTFNEQVCEYRREQVPSFRTVDAAGSTFASIEADRDRDHDAVRRKLRGAKAGAGDPYYYCHLQMGRCGFALCAGFRRAQEARGRERAAILASRGICRRQHRRIEFPARFDRNGAVEEKAETLTWTRARHSGRCMRRAAHSSSPTRGTSAPPSCWRRWVSRRSPPPAPASPSRAACRTARVGFEMMIHHCREIGACHRPAGFGRSGKGQGRQPRKRRRDDLRGRGRRARRLLDRRSHRRPAQPDLRFRSRRGARGCGRRCRALAETRLRLHGARRELSVGPARSRRHDPPAAGLRQGRRRRALRAGHRRCRHGREDLQGGVEAGQRAGGAGLHRRRPRQCRRQAHLARLQARHLRLRHAADLGARDAGGRHVRLHPRRHAVRQDAGTFHETAK